jgi:hypothetical protein
MSALPHQLTSRSSSTTSEKCQYRTNAWQRIAAKGRPPRDGLLDFRPGILIRPPPIQRYAFRKASRSALRAANKQRALRLVARLLFVFAFSIGGGKGGQIDQFGPPGLIFVYTKH